MPLSAKLIEAVLVEQDPEGLISIGDGDDAYETIAEDIFYKLNNLANRSQRIVHENNTVIINYIGAIAFVLNEAFGSGIQYNGDNPPTFFYDEKYIAKNLDQIKIIAKLIFDIAKKE